MARFVSVDDQLAHFEQALRDRFNFNLIREINLDYWAELDRIDGQSLMSVRNCVMDPFVRMRERYTGTPVETILARFQFMVWHMLPVALNVPWPGQNTALHVQQVGENMMDFYNENVYAQLRTEMIMMNHSAHIIQRTWRHVASNPGFAVCRRRLVREYEEIVSCVAEHWARNSYLYNNGAYMVDVHEPCGCRPCSV